MILKTSLTLFEMNNIEMRKQKSPSLFIEPIQITVGSKVYVRVVLYQSLKIILEYFFFL